MAAAVAATKRNDEDRIIDEIAAAAASSTFESSANGGAANIDTESGNISFSNQNPPGSVRRRGPAFQRVSWPDP